MPNTESAARALRKMERRRIRNRQQRSALRTSVKKVRTAVTASALPDAQAALALAIKKLDQSAAKRLIHPNKAARDKSRLMKLVNKLAKPATDTAAGQAAT